jgi:hypothetical protein
MAPPFPFAYISTSPAETGMVLLLLGWVAFWAWMIVDCIRHEEEVGNKLAWILVIVVIGLIGAPLYFFVRHLPRKRRER